MLLLQNLQLQDGSGTVLEGVAIGLVATAIVGVLTFWLHAKLPYKRMLVLTGVLVGAVLVVMIGGFVIGSYYAAEYVKVKRPQRRGQAVTAKRATAAPAATTEH